MTSLENVSQHQGTPIVLNYSSCDMKYAWDPDWNENKWRDMIHGSLLEPKKLRQKSWHKCWINRLPANISIIRRECQAFVSTLVLESPLDRSESNKKSPNDLCSRDATHIYWGVSCVSTMAAIRERQTSASPDSRFSILSMSAGLTWLYEAKNAMISAALDGSSVLLSKCRYRASSSENGRSLNGGRRPRIALSRCCGLWSDDSTYRMTIAA